MNDTPEQFLKDVVDADHTYLKGFNTDLLIGNFRITEFIGMPQHMAEVVAGPVLKSMIENAKDYAAPRVIEIKKIIDNPPKCINDQDVYQAIQYFSKVEGPWAKRLLQDTFVKEYVTIPVGTAEFMENLSRIPLCP